MNKTNYVREIFLGLLLALLVSACGTLTIDTEPTVSDLEEGSAAIEETEPAAKPEDEEPAAPTETAVVVAPEETAFEPAADASVESEGAGESAGSESEPAASLPSETVSLDETWLNYTNHHWGFSINFPITMMHFFGSCHWDEADESYRPEYGYVPVTVFEAEDTVYIAPEYFHELGGETRETDAGGGTRRRFAECESVDNSLALLQDPERPHQHWAIVVAEVADEEALDAFVKARYGAGCSKGEMVPAAQEGVYDISIQGDGKDLEATACPLNFGAVVKYYLEGRKVAAWDTGQTYTFAADENSTVTYDQEMVDSFRFLTGTESEDVDTGE